jgi:catechol 2,3-dioxygenase-like lactoylglutathione lyase family enzyme
MLTEVNHIGIVVSDIDASLAFYRDELGGEIIFQKPRLDGTALITYLRVGDGYVELLLSRGAPLGAPGPHHIGMQSTEIHADHDVLVHAEAESLGAPARAGTGVGSTSMLGMPGGARMELVERDVLMAVDDAAGLRVGATFSGGDVQRNADFLRAAGFTREQALEGIRMRHGRDVVDLRDEPGEARISEIVIGGIRDEALRSRAPLVDPDGCVITFAH